MIIAMDGGRTDTCCTSSMAIIVPNIREEDEMDEWMDRHAIPVLIRVCILPQKWGMEKTSINVAELVALCIAEYRVPEHHPAAFILDSDNA